MTTITLEVPDELAARLSSLQAQLPELLSLAVELFSRERPFTPNVVMVNPAYKEILDFLASGPTPEQIVAFKVSPSVQARLEELLDKNREDGLTDDEAAELEGYAQLNHVMILLKAHASSLLVSLS